MSGIWDRIIPGEDRCSSHLLKAAMYLAVRGIFTDQQIIAGINSRLIVPLSAAAQTDLGTIRASITAATELGGKIDILERFDALNIAAEMGILTNQTTYRTQLGI